MAEGIKVSKEYIETLHKVDQPYCPIPLFVSKYRADILSNVDQFFNKTYLTKYHTQILTISQPYEKPDTSFNGLNISKLYFETLHKVSTPYVAIPTFITTAKLQVLAERLADPTYITKQHIQYIVINNAFNRPDTTQNGTRFSKTYYETLHKVSSPVVFYPIYNSKLCINVLGNTYQQTMNIATFKLNYIFPFTNLNKQYTYITKKHIQYLVINEPYITYNNKEILVTPYIDINACINNYIIINELNDRIYFHFYKQEVEE